MQPLRWYLNRLRAMSPAEIGARSLRQGRFALERAGLLTAKHVPSPSRPPEVPPWPIPTVPNPEDYVGVADRLADGRFEFFGERFDFSDGLVWNADPKSGTVAPLAFGKTLDYRDNALVGDIKYVWELSRHLEVVPLAQAFALTGDPKYLQALRALIESWVEQCPYPLGPNWCSSLELGIRLINWALAYELIGGAKSPAFEGDEGQRFFDLWSRAVYQHIHFIMGHLSAHSSANNHLIGELAGAFAGACVWPLWPESRGWRDRALSGLVEQAEVQTFEDGVNKEQAVSYQQFVMYFLVFAGVIGERAGTRFPQTFWRGVERMTEYLDALIDARGAVPMIGDADDGIVFQLARPAFDPFRALIAIGGRLFDAPAWRDRFPEDGATADWLCGSLEPVLSHAPAPPRREFPAGGYFLLGSRLGEPDEVRIIADAGPLGFLSIAAHGHADCLALTLSVAGDPILVDPGTYCYHSMRDWRDYFRGTAAHNTVRVDGADQSTIAGPFLWEQKAEASVDLFESGPVEDRFRARHDGYLKLADPVVHVREIRFDKAADVIDIDDEIKCGGQHDIERFWHFSERCDVEVAGRLVTARSEAAIVTLEVLEAGVDAEALHGSLEPKAGWISHRFGHKEPTTTVVFRDRIDGRTVLRTRISIVGKLAPLRVTGRVPTLE